MESQHHQIEPTLDEEELLKGVGWLPGLLQLHFTAVLGAVLDLLAVLVMRRETLFLWNKLVKDEVALKVKCRNYHIEAYWHNIENSEAVGVGKDILAEDSERSVRKGYTPNGWEADQSHGNIDDCSDEVTPLERNILHDGNQHEVEHADLPEQREHPCVKEEQNVLGGKLQDHDAGVDHEVVQIDV